MMNTKMIIGVVVGGFLVFLWQFLSWAMFNMHGSEQKYTADQDAILQMLGEKLPEEGTYFLPTSPPGTSSEDQQKMMEASGGKPWAQISYHKSMNTNMGMNMFRGFLTDIVAVFLLVWLLGKIPECTMGTSIMASVTVGVIGYLTTEYTNSIWFETNSIPDLIDAVVSWAICGTWLGYWMNR
ncbi:MAG: hypothetical protein IPJ13_15825 [Saprospiraceae bacterium]|jgi:uncharacterized membrane protein YeaQ/YmgE (transglycosylase-associated protein family)|nr:hypothetical protein [Saprospiraceae bacterium]MBK9564086.1 hypothetical protein [Saprospiraceae bacterium]MBP6446171.1 hypothetical protein [Saprospiraceae bacterium]